MEPYHAVVLTFLAIAFLTPVTLLYWLLVLRPITSRTSQGQLYPRGLFGLRLGGGGISKSAVRGSAIFALLLVAGLCVMTYLWGYVWWFGGAAYFGFWMVVVFLGDLNVIPTRFRQPMKLFALGFIPFTCAFILAWGDYVGRFVFPTPLFFVLNAVSAAVFVAVAARPACEEPPIPRIRPRHHR